MADITLETTHALLEKLADYVMTEVPTRNELQHGLNELRQEMDGFRQEMIEQLALKADKSDVQRILEGMDAQAQQLDILRTDMKAVSGTLDLHKERLGSLEEHNFGRRIRENKENYKADRKKTSIIGERSHSTLDF